MSDDLLKQRKNQLLAKLEQRNEERKLENGQKNEGNELDELMSTIKKDLEEKRMDDERVEKLQQFLAFSTNNRQSKAIQNLLEDVRKFKLSLNAKPKFTGFSFKKATPTTFSGKPSEKASENAENPKKPEQNSNLAPIVIERSKNESLIENLKNVEKSMNGENGEDLSLKNVENCRLLFDFEPSIVHLRNIKNSTLLFRRCDRSILMYDCENLEIHVAAQQIRIHTSHDIHLHVATRGTVIIEDSSKIFMYPYRLKCSKTGQLIAVEDNGEWKNPKDFNWLASSPSPNWQLTSEDKWAESEFLL